MNIWNVAYKLLDAWLTSDDPEIRKLADRIDEEGNNVLIRIRLKKNGLNNCDRRN